jgi:hypothetical protein
LTAVKFKLLIYPASGIVVTVGFKCPRVGVVIKYNLEKRNNILASANNLSAKPYAELNGRPKDTTT